jgi:hypothetical protein
LSRRVLTAIFFLFGLTLGGCVSSEETGAGDRAKSPVQILGTIDTTRRTVHREVHRDAIPKSKIDTVRNAAKPQRTAPKFKSKQDTVRASIITKTKTISHPFIKIVRPEHPFFTVQIGAFAQTPNALRAQKRAKERFSDQPVFNNYIKSAKLYRVSVGRYEDQKDAFALSDTLKQKYPKEYQRCWINFIP